MGVQSGVGFHRGFGWKLEGRLSRTGLAFVANLVAGTTAIEPADAEHVGGGAKGAVSEAVFADAVDARAVIDGDFGDAEVHAADQRWDEAMHAVEEEQGFPTRLAHDFKGAASVTNAVAYEA